MSSAVGWTTKTIGEIASEVTSGGTPQSGSARYYTEDGGIPFAKIDDLTSTAGAFISDTRLHVNDVAIQETSLKAYPSGTILLSMYGTIGLVKVTSGVISANQALAALLPPFKCDSKYLYQYLVWARPAWEKFKSQTTQANINGSIVKNMSIPIPPLPEQQRIAEILDGLDDQIRSTEKLISKYSLMKQGLVGDLLPLNGQVRFLPLREVAEISGGVTLGSEPSGPDTIRLPYLRVANVQDGHLDLREIKFIRIRASDTTRFSLVHGDVLMNEGGDADKLGRGTVWEDQIEGCLHQNHVFRVRTDRRILDPWFLAHISASAYGKTYFLGASKQTTNLATINSTQIGSFRIPLPDLGEQRRIVEVISAHDSLLKREQSTLAKLRSLKAGLASDLLDGRVQTVTGVSR